MIWLRYAINPFPTCMCSLNPTSRSSLKRLRRFFFLSFPKIILILHHSRTGFGGRTNPSLLEKVIYYFFPRNENKSSITVTIASASFASLSIGQIDWQKVTFIFCRFFTIPLLMKNKTFNKIAALTSLIWNKNLATSVKRSYWKFS